MRYRQIQERAYRRLQAETSQEVYDLYHRPMRVLVSTQMECSSTLDTMDHENNRAMGGRIRAIGN
jgi:hypothetical protein